MLSAVLGGETRPSNARRRQDPSDISGDFEYHVFPIEIFPFSPLCVWAHHGGHIVAGFHESLTSIGTKLKSSSPKEAQLEILSLSEAQVGHLAP